MNINYNKGDTTTPQNIGNKIIVDICSDQSTLMGRNISVTVYDF